MGPLLVAAKRAVWGSAMSWGDQWAAVMARREAMRARRMDLSMWGLVRRWVADSWAGGWREGFGDDAAVGEGVVIEDGRGKVERVGVSRGVSRE